MLINQFICNRLLLQWYFWLNNQLCHPAADITKQILCLSFFITNKPTPPHLLFFFYFFLLLSFNIYRKIIKYMKRLVKFFFIYLLKHILKYDFRYKRSLLQESLRDMSVITAAASYHYIVGVFQLGSRLLVGGVLSDIILITVINKNKDAKRLQT